jgi:potassium-transporting ATPase potassium-binding subunit
VAQGFLQIAIFCALIVAVVPVLGGYMARVFLGERTFLDPIAGPLERGTYRLLRIDPGRGQDWKAYAKSVIAFSLLGWLVLFAILRTQTLHPFNPEGFHSGTWDLSFNTASSFVTNTNWQFYSGETTLSYFSQMAGLTVQNFVSAATGIAVAIALIRGIIARRSATPTLGNSWQDLVRASFYVLLPISIVGAVLPRACCRPSAARWPVSRAVRSLRRRPSRSSAPTVAASSTSTRPTRSRTPAASRTCSSCS